MPAGNINTISGSVEHVSLPFDSLMAMLQREGFVIRPDDYLQLLSITGEFVSGELHELKYRIAPLVATSEQEQKRFYALFDEYVAHSTKADERAAEEEDRRKTKKMIAGVLIAVALVLSVWATWYFFIKRMEPPPLSFEFKVNGEPSDVALATDTIVADASGYLQTAGIAKANKIFRWRVGNKWIESGPSLALRATGPGRLEVQLVVADRNGETDSTTAKTLTICNAIVEELQTNDITNLKEGDNLNIEPLIRGNQNIRNGAKWIINDNDTIADGISGLNYLLSSSGNYQVKYLASSSAEHCMRTSSIDIFVKKDGSASVSYADVGTPLLPDTNYRSWLYALFLIPIAGAIVTAYLQQRARRKRAEQRLPDTPKQKSTLTHIDIPLQNRELEMIMREPEFTTLFTGMRKKTEDDTQVLDIPKSIRAEIHTGGIPNLVFTNRLQQQEFLVLIDRTRNAGQQWRLFEYLVKVFIEENIRVEKFHFNQFGTFYNSEFKEGLSLQRLSELYRTHVLLVFGNGYQLLHPHVAAVDQSVMKILPDWELRALVTPVPVVDWSAKERALKKALILLPADVQALVLLVQAIHEKQFDLERTLLSLPRSYEIPDISSGDVDEIREYLRDDLLFQWLCAAAVYPKLRWEIIIETGKAVCEAAGRPEMVNFSNLLKLVRIPWMQEGAIPENTRLKLLKALSVPNEVLARETILRMLNHPELNLEGDQFFKQEKEAQELTSKFVLYAYDQDRYKSFGQAFEAFSARWKQGKVYDAATAKYLDKKNGDAYDTPVDKLPGRTLDDAINKSMTRNNRQAETPYKRMYWLSGITAACIAMILISGKPWIQKLDSGSNILVSTDSTQVQKMDFAFLRDSCATGDSVALGVINAEIRTTAAVYPLQFSGGDVASAYAPYQELARGAVLNVSWNNGAGEASQPLQLSSYHQLLISACVSPQVKPRMRIIYNDVSKLDSATQLSIFLSGRFDVSLNRDDNVQATLLQLAAPQSALGDELAAQLRNLLNRDVQVTTAANPADTVSTLYLRFDKVDEWIDINIAQLPAQLTDIWRSASGRWLTIDLTGRLLWHSTGNKNNFENFRLEGASQKDGAMRWVLSEGNQYRVIFLRNVRTNRFECCVLPQLFRARDNAAQTDITSCSRMEVMTPYYPPPVLAKRQRSTSLNENLYYFSLRPQQSLPASENNRLSKENTGYTQNYDRTVTYNRNNFFGRFRSLTVNPTSRVNSLRKMLAISPAVQVNRQNVNSFQGTPFDRDYVSVSWSQSAYDYNRNAPVTQQTQPQSRMQQWQFISRMELEPKSFNIVRVNENQLKQLSDQLRSTADARLKVVGYYRNAEQRKEAEYMLSQVVRQLAQYGISNQLGDGKLTTLVREYSGDAINQVIEVSYRQQQRNPYVDLYGVNIQQAVSTY